MKHFFLGALLTACAGPDVEPSFAVGEAAPTAAVSVTPEVSVAAGPTCIAARYQGPVGNCLEPSLLVTDLCSRRVYEFHFDDCQTPEATVRDVSIAVGPRLVRVTATDSRGPSALTVTGARGMIRRSAEMVVSSTAFDLQVDVANGGGIETVHLGGLTP